MASLHWLTKVRDLLSDGNSTAFQQSNFTVGAAEISVDSGAYSNTDDILILAGGRTLFQFRQASADIDALRSSAFVFSELVLPFTAYNSGSKMWLPQFRGNGGLAPKLIGVDWTNYGAGEAGATNINMADEQVVKSYYHAESNTAFLGSRSGVVLIRDGTSATQDV